VVEQYITSSKKAALRWLPPNGTALRRAALKNERTIALNQMPKSPGSCGREAVELHARVGAQQL
jgi:hypothetical protein